jgi:hypothetical protein
LDQHSALVVAGLGADGINFVEVQDDVAGIDARALEGIVLVAVRLPAKT